MKIIRFLDEYVDQILKKKKTSTIRQNTNRIPAIGEYVKLSSRERPEFATAFVKYIDQNPVMKKGKREAVKKIYGNKTGNICRIHFVIHPE
jgi:hypothetical protein